MALVHPSLTHSRNICPREPPLCRLPPYLPRAPIPSPGPGALSDNDTQHLLCAHAVPTPAWSPLYSLISVFKVTPRQRHCCVPRSRCSYRSAERGDRLPRATQLRSAKAGFEPNSGEDPLNPFPPGSPTLRGPLLGGRAENQPFPPQCEGHPERCGQAQGQPKGK